MDPLKHYITFEMRTNAPTVPTASVRSWIRFMQHSPMQHMPNIDLMFQMIVNRHPHTVPKHILMNNAYVVMLMAPAPRDISPPIAAPQSAPQFDKCH
jgi:hypothetical protein